MSDAMPDSRTRELTGSVVVDWPLANGSIVRLELVPIWCIWCGRPCGHVPRRGTSFVSWLCAKCSVEHGKEVGLMRCADQDFWDKLAAEMLESYGEALTQEQLERLASRGELSRGLQLLERESPYRGR